jgi:hypothetical protein
MPSARCPGSWDRFRHLSRSTFKKHRASMNIFSNETMCRYLILALVALCVGLALALARDGRLRGLVLALRAGLQRKRC